MQKLSSSSSETTRIEVNVSEFSRGEISVKLRRDNTLLVHALHLDQFAEDNFFRKELVKTFPIPSGADVDKIRSVIRNTGTLTIDIPMLRDTDAIRRSHEQLLKTIDQPSKPLQTVYNRSSSYTDVANPNHQMTRPPPLTVPKRTGSLGDIEYRQYSETSPKFNIAEFLQSSSFRPEFTPNGKKLILKIDTRGYEADELTVRLVDNNLLVQGRKKTVSTLRRNENKQFSQNIRLPDGIDKYNVTSQVNDDGILVIDVPLLDSVIHR